MNDETVVKTLWSETLVEVLLAALKKNATDAQIKEILKELAEKGFKSDYVINKVSKEMDDAAVKRVRTLVR